MIKKLNDFIFKDNVEDFLNTGIKKANDIEHFEFNNWYFLYDNGEEHIINYFENNNIGVRIPDNLKSFFVEEHPSYLINAEEINIKEDITYFDKIDCYFGNLNIITEHRRLSLNKKNEKRIIDWYYKMKNNMKRKDKNPIPTAFEKKMKKHKRDIEKDNYDRKFLFFDDEDDDKHETQMFVDYYTEKNIGIPLTEKDKTKYLTTHGNPRRYVRHKRYVIDSQEFEIKHDKLFPFRAEIFVDYIKESFEIGYRNMTLRDLPYAHYKLFFKWYDKQMNLKDRHN